MNKLILFLILLFLLTSCNFLKSKDATIINKESLIPYGTYTYVIGIWENNITLKSNGTYIQYGNGGEETVMGFYTVDNETITLKSDLTGKSSHYSYRYSKQFNCLYLNQLGYTNSWSPYYKN